MGSLWKIALPLVVIVVLIVAAGVYLSGKTKPAAVTNTPQTQTSSTISNSPPPATGNPDDIANSVLRDATNEQSTSSDSSTALNAATSDNAEISSFNQAYTGNEF